MSGAYQVIALLILDQFNLPDPLVRAETNLNANYLPSKNPPTRGENLESHNAQRVHDQSIRHPPQILSWRSEFKTGMEHMSLGSQLNFVV